jgi:two-component system osmolarity sensor histidine kinase EnvZ
MLPELSLRRALGNLLDNALRYAPVCPVELVAQWRPEGLALGVLDRGPGIPAAHIEAMFEPFRRMDASRSLAAGGSGLGLAIVKELARTHGWQVSMTARQGGGMQAWLVLPVSQTPPLDPAPCGPATHP